MTCKGVLLGWLMPKIEREKPFGSADASEGMGEIWQIPAREGAEIPIRNVILMFIPN